MTSNEIVKHILEGDEDFDPIDYVKSATNRESAVEVYNGPLVRVIQPLAAYTINNYIGDGNAWDDAFFQSITASGPLYLAVDKSNHDNIALFQPSTSKAWNGDGREQEWKEIPYMISTEGPATPGYGGAKNPNEDKNWLDLQQGLATYFMAQIAKKKNVGQWVKYLTMIGRTDLATNYARYLGRAKLPFGKSIDAVLAMKKAGKRSRNRIARLMKNQTDVKWGERGFWLLFDDWVDLAPFYGESSRYDYAKNAEKIFNSDTREWFENADTKPEDVWDQINDSNLGLIDQLLANRTVYNSDGEESVITMDMLAELDSREVKDIVCDRGNKNDSCEDIYDAIRFAADDAYVSEMENAYYEGYRHALMKQWGLEEDKTIKWIRVGKPGKDKKLGDGTVQKGEQKTMLGLWFPYSTLEEWIKQWKEDEYEDDFYGDIHDLAKAYLEKVEPNDEYFGNGDSDYFNEQLDYHLSELEPVQPEKTQDPAQPELPMSGESDPKAKELEKTKTVAVGDPPDQKTYKGIPSGEAHAYAQAMAPTRKDIHVRHEEFLAYPFNRIEERAGDVKIEFTASEEGAESVVPLLKELRKMGQQGSSRNVKIEDWDGRDSFGFDGDGSSKIGDIKVDGHVVEARGRRGDPPQPQAPEPDPKAFVMGKRELYLPRPNEVEYDVAPQEEHMDFHGHFQSDEPELDRQLEEWIEQQLERGNQWAWCTARVVATWTDPMLEETFHGYAYLGGCNYKSKKDFCHPQGYYPQMKEEAYEDLIAQIEKRRNALGDTMGESLMEAIYKRSTTQIDLPKDIAGHIIQWGELNIADEDLYIDEKDGCGRETEQHVTVLYGLTDPTPPEALTHIVQSTKPFLIEFGGVSVFENPKYDVIKLDVISEELHNLHMEIRRSCPNENKFPDYIPHCTIAYVQKGKGSKYAGQDVFKSAKVARDFWAYDLKFKGAGDSEDGNRVVELISFDKSKDFERDEPEEGEQRYPEATREEPEMAVAESIDAKSFLAQHLPSACPECHSFNLSDPDDEGLVDCLDCGIWFDPLHPANKPFHTDTPVAESYADPDPKKFTENPKLGFDQGEWLFINRDEATGAKTYRHKHGRVQYTLTPLPRKRWRVHVESTPPTTEMSDWEDFRAGSPEEAEATAYNLAYDMVHMTNGGLFRPPTNESDLDIKALVAKVPHHELMQWNEAGPEGGYMCSCGGWRYKLTGWSSSIPHAMREFRAHKRLMKKQPVREAEEINAKEFLNRTTQYRIRMGVGAQTKYLHQEGPTLTWHDFESATLFNSEDAGELIDRIGNPYGGQPVVAELVDDPDSHVHENDAKTLAMRVPTDYVIKRFGSPQNAEDVSYWAGEGMLFYRNINDARLMSETEANANYKRMVQANYSPNELAVVGVKQSRQRGRMVYNESLAGPFEDDGLPGEVSTFLRKVRSKRRPTKTKGQQVI